MPKILLRYVAVGYLIDLLMFLLLLLIASGSVIGPTQRPLPDNTQHSQQADNDAPSGIQTRSPSKPAATDPHLRPRDHRDRQSPFLLSVICLITVMEECY